MALLNHTTGVPVEKTADEIRRLLVRHGARTIVLDYDAQGEIDGIRFSLETPHGLRGFVLPANVAGVQARLEQERRQGRIAPRYALPAQARRVAWRITKDWIVAQVAVIESGLLSPDEALLAYMIPEGGGTTTEGKPLTVYAMMLAQGHRLPALPAGRGDGR